MSNEKTPFGDLLSQAPLATGENTVTLVGALARSQDPGKFVLALGGNQSVTLDVDAVKDHKVLSGMVGQLIVQVEVDRDRVPGSVTGQAAPAAGPAVVTSPTFDTLPVFDRRFQYITEPILDPAGYGPDPSQFGGSAGPAITFPVVDQSTFIPGLDIQQKNPASDKHPYLDHKPIADLGLAVPFALATPHQAPPGVLAVMQGGPIPYFQTVPLHDYKNPHRDFTGGVHID